MSSPARHRSLFPVRVYEAGPGGRATLPTLANWLQQAAAEHATVLGLGMARMVEAGLFWVMARQYVEIAELPPAEERVTVETWPQQLQRGAFRRRYRVTGADGRPLAEAVALWMVFDPVTRAAVPAPDWMAARVTVDGGEALAFPSRTVPALKQATRETELLSRHSDLDANGHVNNALIAAWLLEPLAGEPGRLASLDVIFRSEVAAGRHLTVGAGEAAPGRWRLALTEGDGREHARAEAVFVGQTRSPGQMARPQGSGSAPASQP
ncbi:Acyl-ACP thioesterase [Tistlia consotensis]|uniref:Acyl-ACP thioesterase n=1 Tax=Tistlia consotensis USBA 355 TaxID=560819 RepID=A0A1Y6CVX5_9PROT|nr:acyl-ACP thioesterase domain-containing protein [Tistlia consotensis]SMF78549.1 Acyl-ACP thioesterase [Tistlia consotensis USBA 355]SNS18696.1 Acyl-ACP thioesterase [Tistlia consotensis]